MESRRDAALIAVVAGFVGLLIGKRDLLSQRHGEVGELRQRDIDVLLSALDDYRAVVAAGKVQRWDVVKWAVTVNLGLATAAVALEGAEFTFFLFSLGVAIIAAYLVGHYNHRMTGARALMRKLSDEIAKDCLDVRKVENERQYKEKPFFYDWPELVLFAVVLASSVLPTFALYQGWIVPT